MAQVKKATVTLTPHQQNLESIHAVVAGILGRGGCPTCGRLINLEMVFQGDPGPEAGKGVISVETEGF